MHSAAAPLKKEVTVIPANPQLNKFTGQVEGKILNVCAYARVSTDDEDQLNSFEAQKEYYTDKIQGNPKWRFMGIFPDKGLTGTSLNRREEFNKMMRLCRRGKIDMILCKSVSRWARNTVDGLNTVRELKSLGIAVQFEKENINTLKETSEFLITLFAGFAQAESESLSANVKWGKQKSMKDGNVIFQYKWLLGYSEGEDGQPVIISKDAKTVDRIFREYLAGYSLKQIQEGLIRDKLPAASGKPDWSRQAIRNILVNEKYCGDALMQKTYRVDCISKKVRKNNGELPMYLVKNSHPAIVSREMFQRVQEEMTKRASKKISDSKTGRTRQGKYSCKYAMTERLVCGECGTPYRRCTWRQRDGSYKIVWRCISRLESKESCAESPTVDEGTLHGALLRAINYVLEQREAIEADVAQSLAQAIAKKEGADDVADLENRLARLDEDFRRALQTVNLTAENAETQNREFKRIATEKEKVHEKLNALRLEQEIMAHGSARVKALFDTITAKASGLSEYEDSLAACIIQQVTVLAKDLVRVKFNEIGIELDMTLV
ncbi:recombinase family protein [Christensenella minuta]|uniref:recombinase family protein n=1 Tax=Christensenella minuta TaxID=626937 RepID=UPI002158055E|nr:recombinase family protein [Christensenella minuta]